ncbi:MAG TPA: VOC family protein [Methylophilaceae bacterium]|nr:VOC family protein [Methylophilaceae bacterium]
MIEIKQLMHAGLIVSDLQKSRAFYEGLLGLKPNPARPDFNFEGVWYDIGRNQLHLMVVPNPYVDVVHPEHGGRDNHIAFSVEDVEPIKAALDAAGVVYSASKSGRAAVFCRDPDGNALEFSAVK